MHRRGTGRRPERGLAPVPDRGGMPGCARQAGSSQAHASPALPEVKVLVSGAASACPAIAGVLALVEG